MHAVRTAAAHAHLTLDRNGDGRIGLSDFISPSFDTIQQNDKDGKLNADQVRLATREIILRMLFLIFYTMLTMRNAFNHQIFDYAQSTRLLFVENNLLKEHAHLA
jgi:hypothetical protein